MWDKVTDHSINFKNSVHTHWIQNRKVYIPTAVASTVALALGFYPVKSLVGVMSTKVTPEDATVIVRHHESGKTLAMVDSKEMNKLFPPKNGRFGWQRPLGEVVAQPDESVKAIEADYFWLNGTGFWPDYEEMGMGSPNGRGSLPFATSCVNPIHAIKKKVLKEDEITYNQFGIVQVLEADHEIDDNGDTKDYTVYLVGADGEARLDKPLFDLLVKKDEQLEKAYLAAVATLFGETEEEQVEKLINEIFDEINTFPALDEYKSYIKPLLDRIKDHDGITDFDTEDCLSPVRLFRGAENHYLIQTDNKNKEKPLSTLLPSSLQNLGHVSNNRYPNFKNPDLGESN